VVLLLSSCLVDSTIITLLKFDKGIIVGSDSNLIKQGSLISSGSSQKVFCIAPNIVLCNIDGGADFIKLHSKLAEIINQYRNDYDVCMGPRSIAKIARRLITTQFRSTHVIFAGLEQSAKHKSTSLADQVDDNCSIYEITPGGSFIEHQAIVVGSGADYVRNMVKSNKCNESNYVSKSDTVKLANNILDTAVRFDSRSGGSRIIWTLSENGLELSSY